MYLHLLKSSGTPQGNVQCFFVVEYKNITISEVYLDTFAADNTPVCDWKLEHTKHIIYDVPEKTFLQEFFKKDHFRIKFEDMLAC